MSKVYYGTQALAEVDFDLRPGEIHALVGENGAGKSTLVKIIAGVLSHDGGGLFVDGRPVGSDWNPGAADRRGVSVVHQELHLVPELDVASNIVLGRPPLRPGRANRWIGRLDKASISAKAIQALRLLDVHIDAATQAKTLGASAAQLVLIARGLSRDMRILILDEPTAALTPSERDRLFYRLRTLRNRGVGIVYVSHKLDEILDLCDRITVLRDGRRVATLSTGEATLDSLVQLILNRRLTEMYPERGAPLIGEPLLKAERLFRAGILHGNSLHIRRGEIVGITGLVGAGKSELGLALYGAFPLDSGTVTIFDASGTPTVFDHATRHLSPRDALNHGIALVPEDRKTQGLVLTFPVIHNLILSAINARRTRRVVTFLGSIVRPTQAERVSKQYVDLFRIKLQSLWQESRYLSGGNQQKVSLAKSFATAPSLLILDEPTRGIDVGSKVEIYNLITELAASGTGILLLSSEVPEVVHMCNRVYVMRGGHVLGELAGEAASEATVMRLAVAGPGLEEETSTQ